MRQVMLSTPCTDVVAEHFRFIDPTHPRCQQFTLDDFHSWCEEAEADGFKPDVTV